MGYIREKYQQFRQWQQQPFEYHDTDDHHICSNCGREAENNYCPRCGQKAVYGPITWQSVWQGVMDVWGMGTRSLPYSLWQLLWRPGYLIRDYISGKRQSSFPPVKMLIIVGIASLLITNWIEPRLAANPAEVTSTGLRYVIDVVSRWLEIHQEWSILIASSFLILPIWSLFREAPRFPRHSLPQGFYVQVFAGTQFLVVEMVLFLLAYFVFRNFDEYSFGALAFIVIVPLLLLIDFQQLFGYGWWGTLWRSLMAVPMGLLLLKVLVQCGRIVLYLTEHGVGPRLWELLITGIDRAVLLWLLMEVVGVVNRKQWRDNGWWQALKWPLLAALVYLVITGICFALGYDGGLTSIFKTYLALMED